MENNTPMTIMNAEMESLMADYNEVMIEFAEASMIEDNYTEKYEKRDKCRIVKAQIDLLKKLMKENEDLNMQIKDMKDDQLRSKKQEETQKVDSALSDLGL